MPRVLIASLLTLGLTLAGRELRGQRPDAAFQPLDFLAGSCWRGTFPDGKATDAHCFDWVYGGPSHRRAITDQGQ